jgi:hypothetical protein
VLSQRGSQGGLTHGLRTGQAGLLGGGTPAGEGGLRQGTRPIQARASGSSQVPTLPPRTISLDETLVCDRDDIHYIDQALTI